MLAVFGCVLVVAALACTLPQELPPTNTAPPPEPDTPLEDTDLPPTPTHPAPTQTPTPTQTPFPTPTQTPTSTPTSTISPWALVSGTWSGCVDGQSGNVVPCDEPLGGFVTLYLAPHCTIGEYCGNLARGAFYSEGIILKLTLEGISGQVINMNASAVWYGEQINESVTIELSGSRVRVVENGDIQRIYLLYQGCDPVIVQNVTWQCSTNLQ
jgi:hypothetical protein